MKADTDAVIDSFGKNEQVKEVFLTVVIAMVRPVLARVVDPVTAQQVVGILWVWECEVTLPPHLSSIEDTGNKRVRILRKNKPISGSFSFPDKFVNAGKPCITPLFSSCGE
jgi:hypothetical protein